MLEGTFGLSWESCIPSHNPLITRIGTKFVWFVILNVEGFRLMNVNLLFSRKPIHQEIAHIWHQDALSRLASGYSSTLDLELRFGPLLKSWYALGWCSKTSSNTYYVGYRRLVNHHFCILVLAWFLWHNIGYIALHGTN